MRAYLAEAQGRAIKPIPQAYHVAFQAILGSNSLIVSPSVSAFWGYAGRKNLSMCSSLNTSTVLVGCFKSLWCFCVNTLLFHLFALTRPLNHFSQAFNALGTAFTVFLHCRGHGFHGVRVCSYRCLLPWCASEACWLRNR